jgi:hypothetical protein
MGNTSKWTKQILDDQTDSNHCAEPGTGPINNQPNTPSRTSNMRHAIILSLIMGCCIVVHPAQNMQPSSSQTEQPSGSQAQQSTDNQRQQSTSSPRSNSTMSHSGSTSALMPLPHAGGSGGGSSSWTAGQRNFPSGVKSNNGIWSDGSILAGLQVAGETSPKPGRTSPKLSDSKLATSTRPVSLRNGGGASISLVKPRNSGGGKSSPGRGLSPRAPVGKSSFTGRSAARVGGFSAARPRSGSSTKRESKSGSSTDHKATQSHPRKPPF